MKKVIKNLILALIAITLIYSLYLVVYKISTNPYDELWNFNNVYKMYNGYRIYESANVIITPLFYYIALLWMKIFGPTVISIKYLGIVIFALTYFILYALFKELNITKVSTRVGIFLLLIRTFQVIANSANYNFLVLAFYYLGFLIILKKDFKFKDLCLGIIYFLIFMSKQNMIIYFVLATLIFDFYKKKSFGEFLKKEIIRAAVFFVLSLVFIFIYYKIGLLDYFINYAFGGISNFGKSNLFYSSEIIFPIICIITLALDIYTLFFKNGYFYKIFEGEKRDKLFGLFIYSIFSLIIVIPIMNTAHFLMTMPLFLINLVYVFDNLILKDFFDNEKAQDYSLIIILIIMVAITCRILYTANIEEKDTIRFDNKNTAFYNLYFEPRDYEIATKIPTYITEQRLKGKNAIVISYDSCLSNIPLKNNNGVLDLVFEGNLGKDGSQGVIEKLKATKNAQFLILTDEEERFWQESTPVLDYIINNYTKTGEILNYSIYE